jgi:hypothetical protein
MNKEELKIFKQYWKKNPDRYNKKRRECEYDKNYNSRLALRKQIEIDKARGIIK